MDILWRLSSNKWLPIFLFVIAVVVLLLFRRVFRKPLHVEDTDKWSRVAKGKNFELWCAALLRQQGFWFVHVSGRAGDQGVDIIAWAWYRGWLRKFAIQCKCYNHPLGNEPVQEINTGMEIVRADVGVVMTNATFTKGAVAAARGASRDKPILLWDRAVLAAMCGQKVYKKLRVKRKTTKPTAKKKAKHKTTKRKVARRW